MFVTHYTSNLFTSIHFIRVKLKQYLFIVQELSILQDMGDTAGECRAHGNLGAVHLSLCNNTLALKCYQEQLDRAQELKDGNMEAQSYGNMGITRYVDS